MTGTLGSEAEREMLESVYNLRTGFIPSFMQSQLMDANGTVCGGETQWSNQVSRKIEDMIKKGRAVLVICETIGEAKAIFDQVRLKWSDVRLYSRNDSDEHDILGKKVNPGTVIIATNLAGRGTDIVVSRELIKNGGLHVIVAFLPPNLRVEKQAFGRTARQGAPGSAELVINVLEHNYGMHALGQHLLSVEDVKRFRKIREMIEVYESQLLEVTRISIRDSLFEMLMTVDKELAAVENDEHKRQELENRAGMQFAVYENRLRSNQQGRRNLEDKVTSAGFWFEKLSECQQLFSLYEALSQAFQGTSEYRSAEMLQFFALAVFLQMNEKAVTDFSAIASQFDDAKALGCLARLLELDITVIRCDKSAPDVYKVINPRKSIVLGLIPQTKMYLDQYCLLKESPTLLLKKEIPRESRSLEPIKLALNNDLIERVLTLQEAIVNYRVKNVKESGCDRELIKAITTEGEKFFDKQKNEYMMKNAEDFITNPGVKMNKRYHAKENNRGMTAPINMNARINEPDFAPIPYQHAFVAARQEDAETTLTDLNAMLHNITEVQIPNAELLQGLTPASEKTTDLAKQNCARIELWEEILKNVKKSIKVADDCRKNGKKIRVKEIKRLVTVCVGKPNEKEMKKEAEQMSRDGIPMLFEIEEKPPERNWWGAAFLFFVGIVQVCVGATLCACGGYNIGGPLIMSGVKDVQTAVLVATGQCEFDLKKYFSEKAVFLLTTIASSGISSALSHFLPIAAATTLEEADFRKRIAAAATSTAAVLATPEVKKFLSSESQILSQFRESKNQLRDKLSESILVRLKPLCQQVAKLAKLDEVIKGSNFIEKLTNIVRQFLNDNVNLIKNTLNARLASVSQTVEDPEVRTLMINGAKTVNSTQQQLTERVDRLGVEIAKKIAAEISTNPAIKTYYETYFGSIIKSESDITARDAPKIVNLLKVNGALNDDTGFNESVAINLDFGEYKGIKTDLIEHFKTVLKPSEELGADALSRLTRVCDDFLTSLNIGEVNEGLGKQVDKSSENALKTVNGVYKNVSFF